MIHVSIILVHFNTPQHTLECLESLSACTTKRARVSILVIDNGSKEPFVVPQKFANDNVTLLRSESNLGFTGGNNLGIYTAIEQHSSDYILLLNNDTVVDPHFIDELIKSAEEHPDAGVLSPKIYFYPGSEYHKGYNKQMRGSVIWYGGASVDRQHAAFFHRYVDEVDRGQCASFSETDFVTGCAMFIKREVLEKVGVLNKRYFLYLEDVDLSFRAKQAGYKLGVCPSAVIWHKNAGSADGVGSDTQTYYQTRNKLLFATYFFNLKEWLPVLLQSAKLLFTGAAIEKQAIIDAVANRFGKQHLL